MLVFLSFMFSSILVYLFRLHPSASAQVGDQVFASAHARSAGTVRGVCGDSALALLRIDDVLAGGASEGHVEIRRPAPAAPRSSTSNRPLLLVFTSLSNFVFPYTSETRRGP